MRVLFLQQQPCVRALKYAVALRARCPKIRLGFVFRGQTLSELYGTGDDLFERWWRLDGDDAAELRQAVREFRPDVIHSHNLPDSLTVLAQELADGCVPVVHDVHDLQSLRQTPYEDGFPEPPAPLELERLAVEGSAGLVTVSDELLAEIEARYQRPPTALVFPNLALGRDLPAQLPAPDRPRNGRLRLVYQGTLAVNDGHYDLRTLFASITAANVKLDVYPNRGLKDYRGLGVRLHRKLAPVDLLAALPRYDLGWAGFNAVLNGAHLDTALPNKVFEYLGCGLPVLALRHKALARLLERHGVGVVLDDLDDLGAQLADIDLPALRRRVAEARLEFTVESRIDDVADLYEEVAS
jgi:glycosyltransferase involved in cell wall biosynthesis